MKLSDEQCRDRVAHAQVLRLATADQEGRPHLVPATFALRGDLLVIAVDHKPKRSTDLKRLRNIEENPKVAALVDHYEDDWRHLWWVRIDGEAVVVDPGEAQENIDWLVAKYHQYRETRPSGPVIIIRALRWSGWTGSA